MFRVNIHQHSYNKEIFFKISKNVHKFAFLGGHIGAPKIVWSYNLHAAWNINTFGSDISVQE